MLLSDGEINNHNNNNNNNNNVGGSSSDCVQMKRASIAFSVWSAA
jgi:hypothetical protein